MRKEEIDELQREVQKNLGEKWEVKPMSVKKIGGDKEAIGCRFQGDEFMVVLYPNEYENLLRSGALRKSERIWHRRQSRNDMAFHRCRKRRKNLEKNCIFR